MVWVRALILLVVVALGLSAPLAPAQAMDEPAPSAQSHAHDAVAPDCADAPEPDSHHDHAFCQVFPMALVVDAALSPVAVKAARLSTLPTRLVLSGVDVPSTLRPPRGS